MVARRVGHAVLDRPEQDLKTLVAIPVHNEQEHLMRVLDEVLRFHDEVLVVDDGSRDDTTKLLAGRSDVRVLTHPTNLGYGKSLIDAFRYAHRRGYDWVITMDCDEQHEPSMIPVFKERIAADDADIISGSRYLRVEDAASLPPPERRTINVAITTLINALFGWQLTDAFCGFKAHRVGPTHALKLDEPGYAFPLQLWPRAYSAGLRIVEQPVKLIYNDPNRTFGDGLDDAQRRLRHYLDVLTRELHRQRVVKLPEPARLAMRHAEAVACGCCHG